MTARVPERPARPRPVRLALALVLLVALPVVPGIVATGSPAARIPGESLVVLLLLAVTPWRRLRIGLASAFAVFVVVAIAVAGIDRGFRIVLGNRFDPLDWPLIGSALGVASDSIGAASVAVLVAVLAVVALAAGVALAWAALHVDAVIRRARRARTALTAVTAGWVTIALVGSVLAIPEPVTAAASTDTIGSAFSRASAALHARAAMAHTLARDAFAAVPGSELLTALRGKDVVFAFVESYGRVAVEGTSFSAGVRATLREGEAALSAHGYAAQSAWLTSPTFGAGSWLAHATLHTGVWIDAPAVYDTVVESTRFTLSDAFRRAGWSTIADVPSNVKAWPVGTTFYHYDTLLGADDVGYRGPVFGYGRIPDQYTWKHFADTVLAGPHAPVMAEIDLVSSHAPWAPLPQLVPWAQATDSTVYDPQPAQSEPAAKVWQDARTVQRFYGQSIQYSLGAMFSFLENVDDPNLVVIALGDHQPATIVSGEDAGHDVPISIIARDPAVMRAVEGWHWTPGMRPTDASPVWRMDAFRDRFLTAFAPVG
ncbi:hypothetical protein GH740_12270 [Microbacterium sp. SYP-A9085]|uniref:hypothetical protein n=1 Tax=Microbacterium sp. SYP-A9085 TaxID=2664454 RepID=UPI00129A1102|nr:hypothetical protein [Microbacterium sp. SYP-A9085]MRH30080.1 hypothetical protein [Microbacterium sp. SYP-A9085]